MLRLEPGRRAGRPSLGARSTVIPSLFDQHWGSVPSRAQLSSTLTSGFPSYLGHGEALTPWGSSVKWPGQSLLLVFSKTIMSRVPLAEEMVV